MKEPTKPLMRAEHWDGNYIVLVQPYLLGQFRIQLCDKRKPDPWAPKDGQIVREMCTYDGPKATEIIATLVTCDDPEAYCESLSKPWNCEHPGGRIRLDNKPEDRKYEQKSKESK